MAILQLTSELSGPVGLTDRPLKICVATWAPFLGGAEIGAERVAIGLQNAGHDVFVIVGEKGPVLTRFERAGLRCLCSPILLTDKWNWLAYLKARNAVRRLLKEEMPDIVHSNDLQTHQMMSDAARPYRIPRVTYHKFPFGQTAIDWMNKFGAERHLFVSQGLMDEMCLQSPRLKASSCRVLNDGLQLPTATTAEQRRNARSSLGLPLEKTIVLLVGQIIERKGVAELIQAWAKLPKERRDQAELILLGDAPKDQVAFKSTMTDLANSLHVDVRFAGFHANVETWLQAADIKVLPSHSDPLPLAIMEAMAYGLPVIGSAVTGIPEMIAHEETGLLVPARDPSALAEALDRLIGDSALRSRFAEAGRRRCEEKFNVDLQVMQLVAEYRQLLSQQATKN